MYTNVTRGVAVGFLRYHLKMFHKAYEDELDMVEFELDSDYERDDDNEERETKRRRLEQKSRPTFKAVRYEEIFLTSTESQDGEDEPVDVCRHLVKQLIRRYPGYG